MGKMIYDHRYNSAISEICVFDVQISEEHTISSFIRCDFLVALLLAKTRLFSLTWATDNGEIHT